MLSDVFWGFFLVCTGLVVGVIIGRAWECELWVQARRSRGEDADGR